MRGVAVMCAVLLAGCGGGGDDDDDVVVHCVDHDEDGVSECDGDCADADPARAPGFAEQACDAVDNDCDEATPDDPDPTDADADGCTVGCGDCADTDALAGCMPEQPCDLTDNDCDAATPDDPDPTDADADGCTVGCGDCADSDATVGCVAELPCDGLDNDCRAETSDADPAPTDADGDGCTLGCGDCDDADAAIGCRAESDCDGRDNDCDAASPDDPDPTDADADGCTAGCGAVGLHADCDDHDGAVGCTAEVACDARDNDCDPVTPDDPDATDADADGCTLGCGDCADADPAIGCVAEVACDGRDNDCDADTVDDPDPTDVDGDGCTIGCGTDEGQGGDCEDGDVLVGCVAEFTCDGRDNDCDAATADDVDPTDADNDGCTAGCGDCDDGDPLIGCRAEVACDGRDNDCDPATVDDADPTDADTDGCSAGCGDCGDGDSLVGCRLELACDGHDNDCDATTLDDADPSDADGDGCTAGCGDCDDGDALIGCRAEVTCDGRDNDCDPASADDLDPADADADGCTAGCGDCADADPAIGCAAEVACDSKDNDCDPATTDAVDTAEIECNGADDDCEPLTLDDPSPADVDGDGCTAGCGDCNDGDPEVGCQAELTCDGKDNDCDAATADVAAVSEIECNGADDDCSPATPDDPNPTDTDGDGCTVGCGDCADADDQAGCREESVCDGSDNDCDGATLDVPGATELTCNGVDDDCEPGTLDVPGATELTCNGVDDDCDPTTIDDDGFANVTIGTAEPLAVGATLAGYLCPGDSDWFVLTLAAGEQVNLALTITAAPVADGVADGADFDVYVYSPDGPELARSNAYAEVEALYFRAATAGEYLVEVDGFASAGPPQSVDEGGYELAATPGCAFDADCAAGSYCDLDWHPVGSWVARRACLRALPPRCGTGSTEAAGQTYGDATAATLVAGGSAAGDAICAADQDAFVITVAAADGGHVLELTVAGDPAPGALVVITILDPAAAVVTGATLGGDAPVTARASDVVAGDYVVLVSEICTTPPCAASTYSLAARFVVPCELDADCAEGAYCDLDWGVDSEGLYIERRVCAPAEPLDCGAGAADTATPSFGDASATVLSAGSEVSDSTCVADQDAFAAVAGAAELPSRLTLTLTATPDPEAVVVFTLVDPSGAALDVTYAYDPSGLEQTLSLQADGLVLGQYTLLVSSLCFTEPCADSPYTVVLAWASSCRTDADCAGGSACRYEPAGTVALACAAGELADCAGDDAHEPDDGFAAASALIPGPAVAGTVCTAEIDFFRVDVTNGPTQCTDLSLTLDWTDAGADLDLTCYDELGFSLNHYDWDSAWEFGRSVNQPETLTVPCLPSGSYYCGVSVYLDGASAYTLDLVRTNVAACTSDLDCVDPLNRRCTDGDCVGLDAWRTVPVGGACTGDYLDFLFQNPSTNCASGDFCNPNDPEDAADNTCSASCNPENGDDDCIALAPGVTDAWSCWDFAGLGDLGVCAPPCEGDADCDWWVGSSCADNRCVAP